MAAREWVLFAVFMVVGLAGIWAHHVWVSRRDARGVLGRWDADVTGPLRSLLFVDDAGRPVGLLTPMPLHDDPTLGDGEVIVARITSAPDDGAGSGR